VPDALSQVKTNVLKCLTFVMRIAPMLDVERTY